MIFGNPHWLQLELRTDHDDGTAGVVDALAEQVLTETSLLALEHVGQRLERPVARAGHRTTTAAVVEQGVDGLLQHPLFVVDDDLGGTKIEQSLETVVAVDDPAIEVVEVGGGETATVELHHRAQVGRDDRHRLEDHRRGIVLALAERLDDLHALCGTLTLLRRVGLAGSRREQSISASRSRRARRSLTDSAPIPPT